MLVYLQKHSLASRTGGGATGSNIRVDLFRVDVVLHTKFQPWGSNGVAAYYIQIRAHTNTHTHTDLYYIDARPGLRMQKSCSTSYQGQVAMKATFETFLNGRNTKYNHSTEL